MKIDVKKYLEFIVLHDFCCGIDVLNIMGLTGIDGMNDSGVSM